MNLICQNRHLGSYGRVPGSIPGRGSMIYFSSFSPIFLSFLTRFPLCSTRISKVGQCAAFQLWTPTYSSLLEYRAPLHRVVNSPIWHKMASMALLYSLYAQLVIRKMMMLRLTCFLQSLESSLFGVLLGFCNLEICLESPLDHPSPSLTCSSS